MLCVNGVAYPERIIKHRKELLPVTVGLVFKGADVDRYRWDDHRRVLVVHDGHGPGMPLLRVYRDGKWLEAPTWVGGRAELIDLTPGTRYRVLSVEQCGA